MGALSVRILTPNSLPRCRVSSPSPIRAQIHGTAVWPHNLQTWPQMYQSQVPKSSAKLQVCAVILLKSSRPTTIVMQVALEALVERGRLTAARAVRGDHLR
jgi:hypothetical protein